MIPLTLLGRWVSPRHFYVCESCKASVFGRKGPPSHQYITIIE